MKVTLSGLYFIAGLDRLMDELSPLLTLTKPERLRVDLQSVAFLGPTCLAVLLSVLKRVQAEGLNAAGSVVVAPQDARTRADLERIEFFRVLTGNASTGGPGVAAAGVRPCRQFTTHDEARTVARDLAEAITESVEADRPSHVSMEVLLAELAENVIYHADTELGGIAVAQAWRKRPETELAIVDLGVGIRQSLTKNPEIADIDDDLSAIKTAMQPLVTSTPDRNSGYGLSYARGLLKGNGGVLYIRSGNATVYTGSMEGDDQSASPFPGTIVAMTIRTDRPLDHKHGWNEVNEARRAAGHDD